MTEGRLAEHLADTDEEARSMLDSLILELAQKRGVDESLKSTEQLLWTQEMNDRKAAAEEFVFKNLIFLLR